MSLKILSTTLSFLDINEFQDLSDKVSLTSLLDLSAREIFSVLLFWLSNTNFSVDHLWCFIAHMRNGRYHRKEAPAITWISNGLPKNFARERLNEWCKNGELYRLNGPVITYDNGDCVWNENGLLVERPALN